jgi:hypothetical protein
MMLTSSIPPHVLAVVVITPAVTVVIIRVAVVPIGMITGGETCDHRHKNKCAQPFMFHDHLLDVISAFLTPNDKARNIPTFFRRRPRGKGCLKSVGSEGFIKKETRLEENDSAENDLFKGQAPSFI